MTQYFLISVKQVQEDRKAILHQISERKYRTAYSRENHLIMSPSSSCPNNLDSYLKRDYSTESRATKSSGRLISNSNYQ